MAEIAPLTPLRYDIARLAAGGGFASVVAPPYDVIDAAQRAELASRNPYNIVKLILPEGEGDTKYQRARDLFFAWRTEGVLFRDDEPAFYRFDQTFTPPGGGKARTRRGFLGLVKLVSLDKGIVLPHERTLSGPKEDRLKLFRATRTNFSPGFMLYRDPAKALDAPLATAAPLVEIDTPDGIKHSLAKVTNKDAMRAIVEGVAKSSLLIADGHHRYETALRYSQEATNAGINRPEHNYFMVFLTNGDDPDLIVFPTHRHVHSLARFDFEEAQKGASELFDVTPLPPGASAQVYTDALAKSGVDQPTAASGAEKARPSLVICAGDGRASLLALKPGVDLSKHPILGKRVAALRTTDVALLHMGILEPVLGITPEMQAAKTNIFYPQDAAAALGDLRSGKGQTLFLMNGTPVAQVRAVAEAGEVMPQKSTFFYPKVLTGLAIHTLDPDRAAPSVD